MRYFYLLLIRIKARQIQYCSQLRYAVIARNNLLHSITYLESLWIRTRLVQNRVKSAHLPMCLFGAINHVMNNYNCSSRLSLMYISINTDLQNHWYSFFLYKVKIYNTYDIGILSNINALKKFDVELEIKLFETM